VEDLNFVHQSQDLLTGQKGNFQETVSASPIIQKENHMLEIDLADHIKEETQIQKAVHVGNLTDLRENFQETVSVSPIIQKENHMLGIDLADHIKEETQIRKVDHVGNLTDLRGNFRETVSASLIISHTRQTAERKPYAGDRPNRAFQVGDSNSESQPPREFDGPKREFSGDREHKPFQADGSETERPKRVFDREKSDDSSKDFREAPTSKFSKRDTFKSRNRYEESPAHTPQYKLDRFKEKAPAKIQRRIREAESKSDMVRLNRYIANAGICSRRDADKLIEAGEIKVNNKVITEMGYQVAPTDIVKYGNRKLNREKPVYVLLNKPKDFLTTTEDPNDRKTVMELVKNAGDARIYPVGRLDRNTTGLILLSNDGELADRLTHPSHEIEKIYQAELDKPLTDDDFEKIKAGLTLEDGEIKVDDLAKVTPDGYVIGVKIHSGKNRIVRRIFEHLGYEVTKLDRTTFAGLTKKDLPRGHWRYLTERELVKLKYFM